MPDLVLFQPDIPGNTGTLLRLGACMGLRVHLIEPAGFRLDEKAFRRAGMDYLEMAVLERHLDWNAFEEWRGKNKRRLILLTTKAAVSCYTFEFADDDLLMLGRESSGVPDHVHEAADARVSIPMVENARSLNMALSGAIAISEALRQTRAKAHLP
jgi:tRNA (cytidine/uridine-2'-O-)-methyltransferase